MDSGLSVPPADYCREVEAYLCRKNDGHLVRIVGPSFDLVSRWADEGVPLKVAFRGIDRYVERYYRSGPRRRPVRIDSCEADVLDAFDEWRRAVGLPAAGAPLGASSSPEDSSARHRTSLPEHLTRAAMRLTNARATGALGPDADEWVDRLARELDAAHASARGLRGDARQALIERLSALDAELVAAARRSLGEAERRLLEREADAELVPFREAMAAEAYDRAREAAIDRLVRERFGLPTLLYL